MQRSNWPAAVLALALTTAAHAETVTRSFDAKGLVALSVRNGSGRVDVHAGDGPQATVVADERRWSDGCVLTVAVSGGTLQVEAKSASLGPRDCAVDFAITVPKAVALTLKTGAGAVTVRGTAGEVTFATGSGDTDIDAEVTALDAKVGSGAVLVKGLTGSGDVKTGSGDVALAYGRKPDHGELSVKTGSGNVTVVLPAGSRIVTTFKAGSGRLTNELGDTPGAAFAVSAKTGSGSLTIKKAL